MRTTVIAAIVALWASRLITGSPLSNQIPLATSSHPLLDLDDWSFDWPSEHRSQLIRHVQSLPERRRVSVSPDEEFWLTEGEKAILTLKGIKFIDVTDQSAISVQKANESAPFPQHFAYGVSKLESIYANISTSRMKDTLTTFTAFRTRYYRSQTGRESQLWLLGRVNDIVARHPMLDIKVTEFKHEWGQNSIIARLPAPGAKAKDPVVIVGAHQDSTNMLPFLAAPGADDDGSGSVSLLDTLLVLVDNGYVPKNHSVEFIWHSAEEGGLLGSRAIAQAYQADGRKVRAMLQLDMTAWVKPGVPERVGVIQDFVDPDLVKFLEAVVDEYSGLPFVRTQCGYACSDHASWGNIGAPSAFAIENAFTDSNTGNIHSGRDTIDLPGFSFDHMAKFVRIAVGFIMELAG